MVWKVARFVYVCGLVHRGTLVKEAHKGVSFFFLPTLAVLSAELLYQVPCQLVILSWFCW